MNQVAVFNPLAVARPKFAMPGGPISAIAKALAGGGASGKRLSVKGNVFRLIVDGKEVTSIEDRYLDIVIVNAAPKVARVFYAGAFDADKPAAPDCQSSNGDTPDAGVKLRQSASCATCPQNVKGSGQGDTRACRFSQLTAVVLANDIEGDVMQLSLAASSIFGKAEGNKRPLQDYVRYMVAQGVDPTGLVTRIRFDTNVATPKLFFEAMRWLDEEEFEICQRQGQSPDALKAITMQAGSIDAAARQAAQPAVSAPAAFTAPAPTPAPAPAPVQAKAEPEEAPPPPPRRSRKAAEATAPAVQENIPEPTVRHTAAAPSAVPAGGTLAQTLAEWED